MALFSCLPYPVAKTVQQTGRSCLQSSALLGLTGPLREAEIPSKQNHLDCLSEHWELLSCDCFSPRKPFTEIPALNHTGQLGINKFLMSGALILSRAC